MTVIRQMAVLLLVVAFALSSVIGHNHASVHEDVGLIATATAVHGHHDHHGAMDNVHPAPAHEHSNHSHSDQEHCCAMGGCGMTMEMDCDLASSLTEPVVTTLLTVSFRSAAPKLEGPPPRSIS